MKIWIVNLFNLLIFLILTSNNLYANNTSIFTSKELFMQYSGATLKVSFPETKEINTTSYVENGITMSQGNGLGNAINEYTDKIDGYEFAVNGPEHINIDFSFDINAFGITLYDKNSDDGSCLASDSKFDIIIKYNDNIIDNVQIDPPIDEAFFLGIISLKSFNKIEFREIGAKIDENYGDHCEDDFFGTIFTSESIMCVINDSDNDGIIDQWDMCPGTPKNSPVFSDGCHIVRGDISNNGKLDIEDSLIILKVLTTEKEAEIYRSCKEILENDDSAEDGTYKIDPDGFDNNPPFEVYCDMTSAGGGWTLVAKSTGKEITKLTGDDKNSWLQKEYLGDISNLDEETALGQTYESVLFKDMMIRSIEDSTKLIAWSHPNPISNLYVAVKSGKSKNDGVLIAGGIDSLLYLSDCTIGGIPSDIYYGILVTDGQNSTTLTSLGIFSTKGWINSVIGWGSKSVGYQSGNNVSGGFGIKTTNNSLWGFSRHVHGMGNGCNLTKWAQSKNVGNQVFKSHALFIR